MLGRWLGSLAVGALLLAAPAQAGFNLIPLPEILTDPNEGNTYGILPVVLLLDRQGKLEHIIAHDVRYNRITGWFPSFRLFGYPTLTQRYYVTLRKSEKIDEDYIGEYEDTGLLDGLADVLTNVTYWRDSRLRFFGFGNSSNLGHETNYTQKRFAMFLRFGYRVLPHVEVAWRGRVEDVTIGRGGVPELPFTAERFPDTPGLKGSTLHGEALSVAYDDRDSPTLTTKGTLGAVHVEFVDRRLGSTESYVKYGFELREFVPLHPRLTLATHAVLDYLSGTADVPFYERNAIGGKKSLRGFGDERFLDNHRFFTSAELRTRAFERDVFDVHAEVEVAPFIDVGQVFERMSNVPFDDLHLVTGVGFRGVVRPQVVGFVDVGYGSDGPAVFTGLDYPF
jgi:outer membrane protein assembly factor BamA